MLVDSGMTEDLKREPDGVPHDIVGRTVFASLMLALAALAMFAAGGWIGATVVAAVAIPTMVLALGRRSERERDHVHPSR